MPEIIPRFIQKCFQKKQHERRSSSGIYTNIHLVETSGCWWSSWSDFQNMYCTTWQTEWRSCSWLARIISSFPVSWNICYTREECNLYGEEMGWTWSRWCQKLHWSSWSTIRSRIPWKLSPAKTIWGYLNEWQQVQWPVSCLNLPSTRLKS